jgi:hypothetical protein
MSLATLEPYAVPAIVLVTTLGALITAFVMFRWGSTGSDDAPDDELGSDVDDASREFVSMVRRDRTARRARALRFGQVVAIACFAAAASLAVVALNRAPLREHATPVGPGAAGTGDAQTVAQLEERVRTLEEQLVVAESRAAAATAATVPPTGGSVAAAPPQQPAGESSGPRTQPAAGAPSSKASPEPPATANTPSAQPGRRPSDATDGRKGAARTVPELPAAREGAPQKGTGGRPGTSSSALPRGVAGPTATVGNVRIEILRQPEQSTGGAPASYAVRLTDLRGSPLTDADVSILARMGDGTTAQGVLEATENAGTYTGDVVLGPTGPWDLRLRIARRQTTFELPLASPTSW